MDSMETTPNPKDAAAKSAGIQEITSDGRRIYRVGTLKYTVVGLAVMFGFMLLGDLAMSFKDRSASLLLQLELRKYGATDFFVGFVTGSLPAIINVLLGPLVTYKSDRMRTRWGRRVPILMLSTPIMVITLLGLAWSPEQGRWIAALFGLADPHWPILMAYLVWWSLFDIATVLSGTVINGLINDVVPRAVIGLFMGMFRAVSLGVSIIFGLWFLPHAEAHAAMLFVGLSALFAVGFSTMCLGVKEGGYPPPAARTGDGAMAVTKDYITNCFGNRYYIWVYLLFGISSFTFLFVNAFAMYTAQSFSIDLSQIGEMNAIVCITAVCTAVPIGWIADRYHPMRVGFITLSLYSVAMLLGYFFVTDAPSYMTFSMLHGILAMSYNTSCATLLVRLLPRDRFAQMATMAGILNQILVIVGAPILGLYFDWNGHRYVDAFMMAGVVGVFSLFIWGVLYVKFKNLGGVGGYTPPGELDFSSDACVPTPQKNG
jgi:MFS family permease